jgi:hypothetical protein
MIVFGPVTYLCVELLSGLFGSWPILANWLSTSKSSDVLVNFATNTMLLKSLKHSFWLQYFFFVLLLKDDVRSTKWHASTSASFANPAKRSKQIRKRFIGLEMIINTSEWAMNHKQVYLRPCSRFFGFLRSRHRLSFECTVVQTSGERMLSFLKVLMDSNAALDPLLIQPKLTLDPILLCFNDREFSIVDLCIPERNKPEVRAWCQSGVASCRFSPNIS